MYAALGRRASTALIQELELWYCCRVILLYHTVHFLMALKERETLGHTE